MFGTVNQNSFRSRISSWKSQINNKLEDIQLKDFEEINESSTGSSEICDICENSVTYKSENSYNGSSSLDEMCESEHSDLKTQLKSDSHNNKSFVNLDSGKEEYSHINYISKAIEDFNKNINENKNLFTTSINRVESKLKNYDIINNFEHKLESLINSSQEWVKKTDFDDLLTVIKSKTDSVENKQIIHNFEIIEQNFKNLLNSSHEWVKKIDLENLLNEIKLKIELFDNDQMLQHFDTKFDKIEKNVTDIYQLLQEQQKTLEMLKESLSTNLLSQNNQGDTVVQKHDFIIPFITENNLVYSDNKTSIFGDKIDVTISIPHTLEFNKPLSIYPFGYNKIQQFLKLDDSEEIQLFVKQHNDDISEYKGLLNFENEIYVINFEDENKIIENLPNMSYPIQITFKLDSLQS